jgi:hypothetical protein
MNDPEYSPLDDRLRLRKIRTQQIVFDVLIGFFYNLVFAIIFGLNIYEPENYNHPLCEGPLLTWASITFWYLLLACIFSFHSFVLTILAHVKDNILLARIATALRLTLSLAGFIILCGISISYIQSRQCGDLETVTYYYILLPIISIISTIVILLFCSVSLCLINMAQSNA